MYLEVVSSLGWNTSSIDDVVILQRDVVQVVHFSPMVDGNFLFHYSFMSLTLLYMFLMINLELVYVGIGFLLYIIN